MNMEIRNHLHRLLLIIVIFFLVELVIAQNFQKVDSLQLSLKITENPKDKIETYLILSKELENSNPAKALEYANNANNLAEEIGYEKGILNSMITIADLHWIMTEYKEAMDFAVKSKELAEELGKTKELALSTHVIGRVYLGLGDYHKSAEYFFESLSLFEKTNDKEGLIMAFNSIGSVYFAQNKYEKALEYSFKSMNIIKELNDKDGIARQLNNIAAVYGSRKDYVKARQYIEESLKISKELGNRRLEGVNYLNLGTINKELKNYDKAIENLGYALSVFEDMQNTIYIARCQISIGHYYLYINKIEQSLKHAKKAYEEGEKYEFKTIILNSAQLLSQIYLSKKDTLKSYYYNIIKYQMKDSLNLEESLTQLSKLELQYEFHKKEQEERIKQQQKDYLYLITIISLIFIFVTITIVSLTHQKVKAKNALFEKKQLENKIEFKNKELAINVMSLIKKNEMLSGISDQLILLKSKAVKDETKETIQIIARKLKKSSESEIWEEFELRFKQVHGEFYSMLLENFPNLSQGEQRLCAFLRLNMSTKEISDLTGQSISALEMARFRLRKKLGISSTDVNLVKFLSQV